MYIPQNTPKPQQCFNGTYFTLPRTKPNEPQTLNAILPVVTLLPDAAFWGFDSFITQR
jgi:hypothetical protein